MSNPDDLINRCICSKFRLCRKKMFENWLCPSDDDESEFETSDSEYDNTASETVSELSAEIEDIPKVKENGNGKAHEGVGIF